MAQQEGSEQVKGEVDELMLEIRRVIEDNRKFLERVIEDDFDPEDEAEEDVPDEEL
ncbi:hypothetical protein OR1_01446 [Geobacter sp. OR-1]|uniref:hypothetical protein n=1 Tax=Geobacter sp. OR-1 TaxID=1266765 RepID=UPI0005427B91|nr:hypothetical protein [Geobacter sp. OR-1]GAM09172.1 hypothetical protein OR1_01446 [Geobacter sp. OR-1]